MEENGKIYYVTGIDNSQMKQDAENSKRILHDIGREGTSAGENIDAAMRKVGATIASVFSAKMVSDFITSIVRVRSEIESLEISFETLLGNKEKATALLGDIREFAVKTPMMISDLAKGAKTMLSFNIELEKVMPTLRAIGDISMGDAAKFQSLTLAFSQMSSTGKLMGQDLLQMINAGFNPLAEISERTGKSLQSLKDDMAAGKISADMVAQAFMDATSEGGKFNGMLEKQSHGLTGSISNLKGAIDDMLNELGEKMQDSISGVIQFTTELVRNYKKVADALAVLVAAYGTYKAAVIATNLVMKASAFADNIRLIAMFRKELGLLKAAQQAFNLSVAQNPYILLATAIVAATTAVARLVKRKQEEKQAIIDSTKEMREEYTQTNMLIARLKDANIKEEERKKILEQLKEVNPDIVQGIKDEATAYEKLNERLEEYNKKQLAAIAIKQYTKRNDFEESVEKYMDARDRMESANADMIDLWSTIYERYLGMDGKMNDNVRSMMESLIESGASEAEKVEAVFSALRGIEAKVNASHGAYQGYSEGRSDLQTLLSGLSDKDFQKATQKLDKLEGAYEEKAEALRAKIEQIAFSIYTTDEKARQEFIDSQMAIYFPETQKQNQDQTVEDEQVVKRNKEYWENFKKQKEAELAALEDSELTTKKAAEIRAEIAKAEKMISAYNVSYKEDTKTYDDVAERKAKMKDYVDTRVKEARDSEFAIRQAAIDAQKEGFSRQIQQAKLDYDRLIAANVDRQNQMLERMRDEMANIWRISNPKATKQQELAYRMTITVDNLTEAQKSILKKYADDAEDILRRANQQALKDMLSDYKTYENQRLSIQKTFSQIIGEMERSLEAVDENGDLIIKDEKDRLAVQEAITIAKQRESDAILELEVEYGALNLAAQERNRLEKQLAIEQGKLYKALQKDNNAEEVAKLRAEIEVIRKKIKEIDDATEEATKSTKSFADAWKEAVEEIKDTDLTTQLNVIGSFFDKMSSVEGTNGFAYLGKIISSLGNPVALFSSIVDIFVSDYEKNMERVNAIAEAKMQARLDAMRAHYDELLGGVGNIFGEDMLANTQEYVKLMREIENRNKYATARRSFSDAFDLEKILAGDYTGFNKEAVDRVLGISSEEITFRTERTFLGLFDEYMSFKQLSEQFGIELYDQYGNLNAELAQKILDTYENDLQPGEKEFLEGVIQDSEAYKEAMDGVANYISDLFGNVADSIADDFINSFLESGQAAADFGSVVSDVAKQMVKDLVKSKIIAAMDPFSEQINGIMTGDGTQDEKVAQIMAVFASMQDVMDNLSPEIQALLEGYQQFFDLGDDREGATKGIAQASQDSVDELNGRMTAVQGHTYSISENTKLLLQNTQNILDSVMHIEEDTGVMSSRLAKVETETTRMRSTLDDFKQNGIKIR